MSDPYIPHRTYADGPGGATPITAAGLNNLESGIDRAWDAIVAKTMPAFVVGSYYGPFGLGDDTVAIQNTIQAAANAGGGRVVIPGFPDGGYIVKASQIVMPRWVHLSGLAWNTYGANAGLGKIQQLSGVNDDFIIFADTGVAGVNNIWVGPLSITDLALFGALNATGGHAICTRKPDGSTGGIQDATNFERLMIRRFAKSGIYISKCSPAIISNIVTLWCGGYGIELVDDGSEASGSQRIHHTALTNISGDGNMGYVSDGGGATVSVKGMTSQYSMTMRGIKSEYRIRASGDSGNNVGMGNYNAIVVNSCVDVPMDITGVTHIATGSQPRRPGPAILVKGTGRPNLSWTAVGIRNAHSAQSGTAYPQVRDDVLAKNYFTGRGTLGTETDAVGLHAGSS